MCLSVSVTDTYRVLESANGVRRSGPNRKTALRSEGARRFVQRCCWAFLGIGGLVTWREEPVWTKKNEVGTKLKTQEIVWMIIDSGESRSGQHERLSLSWCWMETDELNNLRSTKSLDVQWWPDGSSCEIVFDRGDGSRRKSAPATGQS
ncbi:hypothetical protein KCU88_g63, partial [Aureobasidium melanogenum]